MTAEQLLADLGGRIGLSQLALDENGRCRLMFDGAVAVDLELDSETGRLHLYAVLGPVPAEGAEQVFRRMLSQHLFGQRTGGACYGLDELSGELLLFTTVDPEATDGLAFQAAVANLLAQAEAWAAEPGGTAPDVASDVAPWDLARHGAMLGVIRG